MNDALDLKLYLQLFRGREDYIAQQGENWYFPIPKALNENYLIRHLEGDVTFGLYVLNRDSYCNLVCIDIDIPKSELREVDFIKPSEKYSYLKHQLNAVLKALSDSLNVPTRSILLEETGGRGYHVWIFFSEPVLGQTAVKFGKVLSNLLDFDIEFFPKQGQLTSSRKFGNLIKLPLGVHRKYGARSSFFYLSSQGPQIISGIKKNMDHLRNIVPLNPDDFKKSITTFDTIYTLEEEAFTPTFKNDQQRPQFEGDSSVFINQCTAMRILRARAESGTRLSHSEAFHFANVLLSVPNGMDIVYDTMRLSYSSDYDRNLAQNEIERIMPLHPTSCMTLVAKGICPDYCKESVRKRNEDPLVPGTTPCSVWLRRKRTKPIVDTENLLERIGTAENLKRTFFQLKQYHEHEDALFFDTFDFEHFESFMDANCETMAKALRERSNIPFAGFMPVSLPKKINEDRVLEYRGMSYSSIYDQAPIQAIFNVVAPIIESEFQSTSYGYRWNTDIESSYRIFEDWREAYPRFRNTIMSALKRHPYGFHVCFDIKGYYDNIDHSILLEQLRRVVPDTYTYQMIERTVRAYSFSTQRGCGLPQGPAYARLLANLYLNEFDIFAGSVASAYFRYVDDFVLVFENEKDAAEGLELVVRRLAELCLELSQDEAKKAVIAPNTDISRVRRTLDKIHYGILDGTRHVEHLGPEAVADFMAAVERHRASPVTIEDLIKINDALPSLLYVVTKESQFPHRLKQNILNIIEFLIKHQWFCPKKLKTIFYRLLEMGADENRLQELFLLLDPTHKVYFLLSVFGRWQSSEENLSLLKSMVCNGLKNDNVYVMGFSIAIAKKVDLEIGTAIDRRTLLQKLSETDDFFGITKWLTTIDYLNQTDDERAGIRNLVGPRSPDLTKIFLLSNLTQFPTVYADSVYLGGLLKNSGALLLPVACNLLVTATDKGELFDSILHFVLSSLPFKPLVISLVNKGIFDKRGTSGRAEIENLKVLYRQVQDNELQQCMLSSVSRIMDYGLKSNVEFAKRHPQIDRYNECYLFDVLDEGAQYDYLELIPEGILRKHIHGDLDEFKSILDDFGVKKILPTSNISYDSSKKELWIEFKTEQRYRELDPNEFTHTTVSIVRACSLAAEIYRKASYFRRRTGKAPLIRLDNLLIDAANDTVVFRTIGRSLCSVHVLEGATIGDEEADIARMLSMLLENLLYKSKSKSREFVLVNDSQGLNAFLSLFINNMKAKNHTHSYSSSRFFYLVEQLRRVVEPGLPKTWLEVVYLRETLKGTLSRFNSEVITWHSVCRALDEHLSNHIRNVCSPELLRDFQFRPRLLLAGQGKSQLHTVSRRLLELALCREDFPDTEKDNAAYLDLVEFVLLYATICLEIVALVRTLSSSKSVKSFSSSPLLQQDSVLIKAGDYKQNISASDLAAMVIMYPKEKTDEVIAGLSLRQLSLLALFACGIETVDAIIIKKPKALRDEVFRTFSHVCLYRIPSIEIALEKQIQQVLLALRSNEDFSRLDSLEEMRRTVTILAQDLKQVRSGFRLSRQYGRADGRDFPPDIRLRRWFHVQRRVSEYTLPGCSLTNRLPSSREGYKSSWDISDGSVKNLMIPSEGLNSLIRDLTKGKIFRFKLSYLYSGRAMMIWDVVAFIACSITLAYSELTKISTVASDGVVGFFSVLSYLLGAFLIVLGSKLLLYDLRYWIPWLQGVVKLISQKHNNKKR